MEEIFRPAFDKPFFTPQSCTLRDIVTQPFTDSTSIFSNIDIHDIKLTLKSAKGRKYVKFHKCIFEKCYTRTRLNFIIHHLVIDNWTFVDDFDFHAFLSLFSKYIRKVEIKNCDLTNVMSLAYAFKECQYLEQVIFSNNLTPNLLSIEGMMYNCRSLISTDGLQGLDVSNVITMKKTFYNCRSLEDVSALKHWDVSNVIHMKQLFNQCVKLSSLHGLESWNVSNVVNIEELFLSCESLRFVHELSYWNTRSVLTMKNMFENCVKLLTVTGLSSWNVSNVELMTGIFKHCVSLSDIRGLYEWNV